MSFRLIPVFKLKPLLATLQCVIQFTSRSDVSTAITVKGEADVQLVPTKQFRYVTHSDVDSQR